jgi:hypothetical protein
MDRLNRVLAGCGLMAVLATTGAGCKSTGPEVPRGPRYTSDGRQLPPTVGLSGDSHPMSANAVGMGPNGVPLLQDGNGSTAPQFGTPAPGSPNMGAPTSNAFGAPGTAGMGAGPSAASSYPPTPQPVPERPATSLAQPPTLNPF